MKVYANEMQTRESPRVFETPAYITSFADFDDCDNAEFLPTPEDSPLVDKWGDMWEYGEGWGMWARMNVSEFARTASRMYRTTLTFYYGPLRCAKEI